MGQSEGVPHRKSPWIHFFKWANGPSPDSEPVIKER